MLRQEGGKYLLKDPTFDTEMWVSQKAVDDEASGYFLIQAGTLSAGWKPVSADEGDTVWGKGSPSGINQQWSGPPSTTSCPPMAVYAFQRLLAALYVMDAPVGYSPPIGPPIEFRVSYNQRDVFQPQLFYYSNLGPKWTFDWISYVEDDPDTPAQTVNVYLRGGGQDTHKAYDPATGTFAPGFRTHAVMTRLADPGGAVSYQRELPDGSKEIFSQPDGSFAFPRKVLLTEWRDPQGNAVKLTYDASLRIVAITDAIGQVTTLSYEDSDPLRITKVTDPFGRFATFGYDDSGHLRKITDVIGLTSEFTYDGADFISTLTTPYGTTHFRTFADGSTQWVEATDPLGGTERVQYIRSAPIPSADPAGTPSPADFASLNGNLHLGVTFYWDKRAMALYPNDVSKADQTTWMFDASKRSTGVPRTTKKPLESRVWYRYPGQTHPYFTGTDMQPSKVGRFVDNPDGSGPSVDQVYQYEYNSRGLKTRETDPVGRTTIYNYDANGIDPLEIRQVNGQTTDLLKTYTYNSQHKMLTATDAAGQTITFTYNPAGQLLTATTAPRAGITENRTTNYAYDANGLLQSVTVPATGATTTYSYDGYARLRTVTDSEGYVVTTDYDALDRPTKVTYPDGTYEQTVYNRLDAQDTRDRLGRWSHTFFDALRRPVSIRDALGRTTTREWCACGSLDKSIDANGNTITWDRDVQGRVTKETRADGAQWTYVYENTTSRLFQRIDAKQQVTTYTYTPDDQLAQKSYANTAITTASLNFTYDPVYRRMSSMTDGTGTTNYSYCPVGVLGAGRLQAVDGPLSNDTVTYTYDEVGRITARGLSAFSRTSSYDALGRLTSVASPVGTFNWTYVNTTGRPQTVTYPNGQVTTYSYFNNVGDQHLQEIKHQQTSGGTVLSQFDYTYSPVGNISTWQQQLGASAAKVYTLGYDAADQLSSAVQKDVSTQQVLKNYGYAYDAAGNKTVDAQDSTATTSQYNNRNELTQQTGGAALPVAGVLSEPATVTVSGAPASVNASNQFTGSAQVGTGTQSFTVVAMDPSGNTRTNTYQVTVSGTAQTLVYDANGNLCAKGGTTCTNGTTIYEWDAENRLVDVKQGSTTLASFVYDAQGRRAQKVAGGITHSYVYDGRNIIEERLSTGQTYDYVQGPGIDRPLAQRNQAGVVSYYLADHLGSVAQTTSNAGAVTLTREYDPWGNLLQGSATGGYAFTGREWECPARC